MQEVPIDMNLQKHWRDHNIVTDDMVRWFKKNCGCMPYHGIKDLDNTSHYGIFSKNIPDGKKSIAIKVTIQPQTETLTDNDLEKISSDLITVIDTKLSGSLRKN